MTPSVEGRHRVAVAALLVGAAAATGSLVGFASGALWALSGLPQLEQVAAVLLVAAAVVADVAHARLGGPRPWSVGRQVPREWSRLFAPATVALLYGARLGVGPLTILPTWLWWAAAILAAGQDPAAAAAAGAIFGAARTLVMVLLAEWLHRAAAARMTRLRAAEPAAAWLLAPLALVVTLLA